MGRPFRKNVPEDLQELLRCIGKNTVYHRLERSLSQAELARKAGLSTTTLSEIETGKPRDIRLSTLCSIAKALGAKAVELLRESDLDLSSKDQTVLLKASEAILRVAKKLKAESRSQ